ncbi:MAG: HD domain-containing protein [Bauldia sp.]
MNKDEELISELVATRAFQRLKRIRFLGAIDYLVRAPNGVRGNIRHTRYEHSLGVARLAQIYSDTRILSNKDRRLIHVAALLHDIGHAPLSHSLEPTFANIYGLDHHAVTAKIIRAQWPLGDQVVRVLRKYKVDIEGVISIIVGENDDFDGFFAGPINFDTIEGVLRSWTYAGQASSPSPKAVVMAAATRESDGDRKTVDAFWGCKNEVYVNIINSRVGAMADAAAQFFMRENIDKFKADDYLSTEASVFKKMPGLRQLLASKNFPREAEAILPGTFTYKVRKFFVDKSRDFFKRRDKERYRQSSGKAVLAGAGERGKLELQ